MSQDITTKKPSTSTSNDPENSSEKGSITNNKKHKQSKTHTQSPHIHKPHHHHQRHKKHDNSSTNTDENSKENIDKPPQDVRIAVIGNVDSGKSTMIGVLTSGERDDGRGSARARILRHNHERSNGRTSCSSQHILGFNTKKKPIHQPISISATPKQKTAAWSLVFSSSTNIVTFIDLAGHEKYLKTTISGLTGCFPDYALIVVGANMGISKMTREHICVAIALSIPLFVVITKIDISPEKILKHTVKTLVKLLRSPECNNKMPMIIRKKKEIKLLFEKDLYLERICPIFCVSAVKGDNLDKLNYFLSQLKPRTPWKHVKQEQYIEDNKDWKMIKKEGNERTEFEVKEESINEKKNNDIEDDSFGELEIDETFAVRGVGIVVSGTVTAGRIFANQKLFLGPFTDSSFKEILVRSVHIKRCSVSYGATAGTSCSVSFRFIKRKEVVDRIMIRKGMVAVSHESSKPKPVWGFTATILVLHHPTTINEGYQPVVHCGNIRQTATITKMSKHRLRSGDNALIDMKFLCHPEFIHSQRPIIIREGQTKCIGKVIALYPNYDINISHFNILSKKYLNNNNNNNNLDQNNELYKLEEEIQLLKEKQKQIKKQKKQQIKENDNDNN